MTHSGQLNNGIYLGKKRGQGRGVKVLNILCCLRKPTFSAKRTKINWEGHINRKLILFHNVTQMLCEEGKFPYYILLVCIFTTLPRQKPTYEYQACFCPVHARTPFQDKICFIHFFRFSPIINFLCWRKAQQSIQFPNSSHQYNNDSWWSYTFE